MKRKSLLLWAVLASLWTVSLCHADTYAIPDTNIVLTYTTSEGRATITSCNRDASGVVNIPENLGEFTVTEIGYRCFVYCGGITELNLPASLMFFGQMYGCPNLTAINVEEGSHSFSSVGGVLYNASGSTLLRAPEGLSGAYSIPESVLEIRSEAFYACSKMTSVSIPEGVKTLHSGCFRKCTGLTNVTIPASVHRIERSPFGSCSSLTAIEVADGNSDYCDVGGVLYDSAIEELMQAPGGIRGHYEVPDTVTSIGDEALSGCSVLSGISIPSSVSSIGYEAFQGCSSLLSVVIPDGISSIRQALFRNCSSLISVSIPDSVTLFEYGAFECCSSLESVVIPAGVTEFKGNCFYECSNLKRIYFEGDAPVLSASNHFSRVSDEFGITYLGTANGFDTASWDAYDVIAYSSAADFTYTDDGAAVTITGYVGSDTDISIPPEINGMPVTSIANNVFINNTDVSQIHIPDSVTSLGESLFRGCSSLENVRLSNHITLIPMQCFQGCENLVGIIIPSDVVRIEQQAFKQCSNMAYVTFASGLQHIGAWAFWYCERLSDITLPESLGSISQEAFGLCLSLGEIRIPESLSLIGPGAFADCKSLQRVNVAEANANYASIDGVLYDKSVEILVQYPGGRNGGYSVPDGVITIGSFSFQRSDKLTSIDFPDSVETLQTQAFYGCSHLSHVSMSNAVASIGSRCFLGCSSLEQIELPDSLVEIGHTCFDSCKALTEAWIPAGIQKLETNTFKNCSSLERIAFKGDAPALGNDVFRGVADSFYINYLASAIGFDEAAWDAYTLIPFTTASDFEYTDDGAAVTITGYVGSDTDILIPPYIDGLPVEMIAYEAFKDCTSLASVDIPSMVKNIGNGAFLGCRNLVAITIPESVSAIESRAFMSCVSLSSVTIPDTVTSLGSACFQYCLGLTDVELPEGLTSIPVTFFSGCRLLGNIDIPDGVTEIKTQAFYGCKALGQVGGIRLPEGLSSIGGAAFYGCNALMEIRIPASVSSIGDMAFVSCAGLEEIDVEQDNAHYCDIDGVLFNKSGTLLIAYPAGRDGIYVVPDRVVELEEFAFCNCFDLSEITFSDSVKSIGKSCFFNCVGLSSVSIPGSVTSLEDYCFKNSSNLSNCTFEGHAPELGTEVFKNVADDFRIHYPASAGAYTGGNWDDLESDTFEVKGFAAWILEGSEQGSALRAGSDPDKDGICNLVEYAMGTEHDATNFGSALPVCVRDGNNYVYSHRRAKNRALNYHYLYTDDLSLPREQWQEANVTPQVVDEDVDDDGEVELVSVTLPLGQKRMFVVMTVEETDEG